MIFFSRFCGTGPRNQGGDQFTPGKLSSFHRLPRGRSQEGAGARSPCHSPFGVPDAADKDLNATGAYAPHGLVQEAVRAVKRSVPDILVTTDVCMCEYTPHSHCGILENGYLVNDKNLEILAKTAVSHAEAGSDMVAPAAMLDARSGQCGRPSMPMVSKT